MLRAEDFIDRNEALQAKHTWSDQHTAIMAVGYLRGEAAIWWRHQVEGANGTDVKEEMAASFIVFKKFFKEEYFTDQSTADSNLNWMRARQLPEESARKFGNRVAGYIQQYRDHNPLPQPDERGVMGLTDAFNEHTNILLELGVMTDAIKVRLDAAKGRYNHNLARLVQRSMKGAVDKSMGAVSIKVVAEGVTNKRLREAIVKSEQEGANFAVMLKNLTAAEKRMDAKTEKAKTKYVAPVAVTSDVDSEDDDDVDIHRIDPKKKPKQKNSGAPPDNKGHGNVRGRGRGGNGHGGGRGRGRGNGGGRDKPPTPCFVCNGDHWVRECPNTYKNKQTTDPTNISAANAQFADCQDGAMWAGNY